MGVSSNAAAERRASERLGPRVLLTMAALLAVVTACTDGGSSSSSSASVTSAAATPSVAGLDVLGGIVTAANAKTSTTFVSAAARPTVVDDDGRATVMIIRDEATAPVQPGRYRLVTYCAGIGSLTAQLTVGAVTKAAPMPDCSSSSAAIGSVEVDVADASSLLDVVITPGASTRAAVAYQVQYTG